MPRGQPDFGLYTETPVASGISDPGEAAARLGSINVYDRRGWTVWMDDFEAATLKWIAAHDGAGTFPVLSTTRAWTGIQSVYFVTRAAIGAEARITRDFPLIRLGKVGLEFWIYLDTLTPNYFCLLFNSWDGTNIASGTLRLDRQARTASIVTPAGVIPVSTNCLNPAGVENFTPVKLVIDMDTDHYVRLLIGPDEIDLSAHALIPGGATTNKFLRVVLCLEGGIAGVGSAYADNFILTQNEP